MNIQTLDVAASDAALQAAVVERGNAPQKDGQPKGVAPAQEASGQNDTPPGAAPDKQTVEKLIKSAQDYFQNKGVSLHFKVLEDTHQVQVEMVDEQSKKVIRKMPQDELVKLADNMKRLAKGVLDRAV